MVLHLKFLVSMARPARLLLALLALMPLTGCLFRSHRVERQISSTLLQQATRDQLVAQIKAHADQIQTLDANVDIFPSVGGSKKGLITDYQNISGYVLLRKPAMLRMIGLFPVVRNRAFDMVSDGQTFRLSIPPKNKFIVGRNDIVHPQHPGFENLRPQFILDALLVRPVDPQNEIPVIEEGMESALDPKSHKHVEVPTYIITVIRSGADGWFLSRKITFSRQDLLPHRQVIYDNSGSVVTDANYEQFTDYNGVSFPARIGISRPQEEYSIVLEVVRLKINEPLTDQQFVLQQPAGAQVVRLDLPPNPQSELSSQAPEKDTGKNDRNPKKNPSEDRKSGNGQSEPPR
jgi:outer membrane lipoprotein-sorting protein